MKKSLLAVLLIVAFVMPSFAQKGDWSIDVKGGVDVTNSCEPIVGADLFYEFKDTLYIGCGINYFFDHLADSNSSVYLTLEKAMETSSDTFTNIYPIFQLGIPLPKYNNKDDKKMSGTYVGLGIGTTIKEHFLVEFLFSSLCSSFNNLTDSNNSALTISVGYKL